MTEGSAAHPPVGLEAPKHGRNRTVPPNALAARSIAVGAISAVLFSAARFSTAGTLLHNFPHSHPLEQLMIRLFGPYHLYEDYLWVVTPYLALFVLVWKARSAASAARGAAEATALVTVPALTYSIWHLVTTPGTYWTARTVSYILSAILPLWQYLVVLLGAIVAASTVRERVGPDRDGGLSARSDGHSPDPPEPGSLFHRVIPRALLVATLGSITWSALVGCCWTCGPTQNLESLLVGVMGVGPFIAAGALVSFFGTRGARTKPLLLAWLVASTPLFGLLFMIVSIEPGYGQEGLFFVFIGLWLLAWVLSALVVAVVGWRGVSADKRRRVTVQLVMLELALVAVLILLPMVVIE